MSKQRNTRIVAKKEAKDWLPGKAQLRLMLFALIPVVFMAIIVVTRMWLSDPHHLTIDEVEVTGNIRHVDQNAIKSVIEPFSRTNLYLLDIDAMEDELEFEPWIRSVAITKLWPSKLVVEISEQVPVAFWGEDRMVNSFGEIFDASLPEKKGILPTLFSPEEQGLEIIEKYQQVRNMLGGLSVGVSEFSEDARGAWRLRLTNGIEVEVGREEQEKRLRRFMAGYEKALATKAGKIRKVDLRYTNGFAVAWK